MTQMERFTAFRDYYARLFLEGEDGLLGYAACVTVLLSRHDEDEVVADHRARPATPGD